MKVLRHRFAVLDAYRGVAASVVAAYHFSLWRGFASHLDHSEIVHSSWMMVDFFFALSGFVISYAALERIRDARSATAFMIRRFGRIRATEIFGLYCRHWRWAYPYPTSARDLGEGLL